MPDPTPTPDPTTEPTTDPAEPTGTEPTEADPLDGETFPAAYVTKLRKEAAKYRARATGAEEVTGRLRDRIVRQEVAHATTGVIVESVTPDEVIGYLDPSALLDEDGDPDPAKIRAAVDTLLQERPHLRRRYGPGDQGPRQTLRTGTAEETLSEFIARG